MKKYNFVYTGQQETSRIRYYAEWLEESLEQQFIGMVCLRPTQIPLSAEREGEYFINRKQYLCFYIDNSFVWFGTNTQYKKYEIFYYWDKILTYPTLTEKQYQALLSVPRQYLNTRGRWERHHIAHSDYYKSIRKATRGFPRWLEIQYQTNLYKLWKTY